MTRQYNLVAIGTGRGASVAASRCRSAGWSVAVIDHLPFGGTFALRGCDPKKVLVGAAEAIDHCRRMRGEGIAGGEPAIAWNELIKFKRTFTEPVPTAPFQPNGPKFEWIRAPRLANGARSRYRQDRSPKDEQAHSAILTRNRSRSVCAND